VSVQCCPLTSNYDDAPSCTSTVTRRARKEHQCYECREVIPAGASYEYCSGIWDGRADSFKTCLSCVEIRNHFACEGWLFGQVWSDIEENLFPDMKAGGPCMKGLSPEAKTRLFERRLKWLEDSA
jgi:hypothetical protein